MVEIAMRRSMIVLIALLLVGCGGHASSGSSQAPHSPSGSASSSSGAGTAAVSGISDDFPLGQGLAAGGDTTVSAPRHDVRGVRLARHCWRKAWPGPAEDRLVVQQSGPELAVTRELVLYRNVATAVAVAERVRDHAARCHRLPASHHGAALDVTELGNADTGVPDVAASFAMTQSDGQPSGSVYVFTQVGRAVLAVQDSGEWTRGSIVRGARHLVRADRGVVARMCVFADPGC